MSLLRSAHRRLNKSKRGVLPWLRMNGFILITLSLSLSPLPPLSTSPPWSSSAGLLLSAAETGCVTSAEAGAAPRLKRRKKMGRRLRGECKNAHFCHFLTPFSSYRKRVGVSLCAPLCACARARVCVLAMIAPLTPLLPCNTFTQRVRCSDRASASVGKGRKSASCRAVTHLPPSPLFSSRERAHQPDSRPVCASPVTAARPHPHGRLWLIHVQAHIRAPVGFYSVCFGAERAGVNCHVGPSGA